MCGPLAVVACFKPLQLLLLPQQPSLWLKYCQRHHLP
jgi:hypothetical protein